MCVLFVLHLFVYLFDRICSSGPGTCGPLPFSVLQMVELHVLATTLIQYSFDDTFSSFLLC